MRAQRRQSSRLNNLGANASLFAPYLLAKSKYNLDKEYIISFADIDIPTAKETAEIREINARTDSTYINAGVLAPDEVRQVLRENENSGYSALEEEMPDSEDFEFGGSETSQSPFSEDEEPKDWFTSNGAHIPIENGENQQEAFENHVEKCHDYDKLNIDKIPPVIVGKQEYAKVIQSFDTYLPLECKKQGGVFVKDVFPHRYIVYYKGLKFKILKKI
ncbi:MAG: hypothetical protein K6C94_05640 [Candidatus Gastranaerophilales bacterium]|nr:hypothetical protein [Candidatus Gastranaerophilales bacterium]